MQKVFKEGDRVRVEFQDVALRVVEMGIWKHREIAPGQYQYLMKIKNDHEVYMVFGTGVEITPRNTDHIDVIVMKTKAFDLSIFEKLYEHADADVIFGLFQ